MKIVVDENMPLVDEFFADMGDIVRLPGRAISAPDLAGADLLLVRSVTRVDAALLAGARPRFVGSATIGTDHVDTALLAARGIPFAAAPGCNARAVGDWVIATVLRHAATAGRRPGSLCLGVVGCGNTGRAVVAHARALGMRVLACDPLLAPEALPGGVEPHALGSLLELADVVTLHVPLVQAGPHATRHLLDAGRLARGRWELLVNAARGPVVDNAALLALLEGPAGAGRRVALDVWEAEPAVPPALLARTWQASPHVAGYSQEGKWRGTAMLYEAACRALGCPPQRTLAGVLAARGEQAGELAWQGSLAATVLAACDLAGDDARLRAVVTDDAAATAQAFDCLRRDYPVRREFGHWRITAAPREARGLLAALGFGVDQERVRR